MAESQRWPGLGNIMAGAAPLQLRTGGVESVLGRASRGVVTALEEERGELDSQERQERVSAAPHSRFNYKP